MTNADEPVSNARMHDTPVTMEVDSNGASVVTAQHTQKAQGVVDGECAFCGSGNEAEPLGWVVSQSLELTHRHLHIINTMQCTPSQHGLRTQLARQWS